ncbi:MAG: hypothetical protein WCI17_11005 [bacterium]
MRALPIILLLLAPLAGRCAITDKPAQSGAAATFENIQTVCKTLMQSGPQGNIDALSRCYAATTNQEVREAITAATGLYWMMNQRIASFERFAEHLRTNFPNSRFQFLLEKEANLVTCTNCAGSSIAQVPCPDCGGTGKCRACGGKGKVAGMVSGGATFGVGVGLAGPGTVGSGTRATGGAGGITRIADPRAATARSLDDAAQQPCAICAGSGTCKICKGAKRIKGRCPFCQGFGTRFTPFTQLAYVDVLNCLRNLAFAAGMAERGRVLLDGRWYDQAAASQILQRRSEERGDFARVAAEAERATDYATAHQLLDRALTRHSESTYTGDVQRVKDLLRADAANKKIRDKASRGEEQLAAAGDNPRRAIGIILEALLEASRRGTNAPLLIASQSQPVLPEKPLNWQIACEPELIGRTARVPVKVDRASRSGFRITEAWEFRLVYEDIQWKVWQTH